MTSVKIVDRPKGEPISKKPVQQTDLDLSQYFIDPGPRPKSYASPVPVEDDLVKWGSMNPFLHSKGKFETHDEL